MRDLLVKNQKNNEENFQATQSMHDVKQFNANDDFKFDSFLHRKSNSQSPIKLRQDQEDHTLKVSNTEEQISPIIKHQNSYSFAHKLVSHNSIEEQSQEYDPNIMENIDLISRSENAIKKKIKLMEYKYED